MELLHSLRHITSYHTDGGMKIFVYLRVCHIMKLNHSSDKINNAIITFANLSQWQNRILMMVMVL